MHPRRGHGWEGDKDYPPGEDTAQLLRHAHPPYEEDHHEEERVRLLCDRVTRTVVLVGFGVPCDDELLLRYPSLVGCAAKLPCPVHVDLVLLTEGLLAPRHDILAVGEAHLHHPLPGEEPRQDTTRLEVAAEVFVCSGTQPEVGEILLEPVHGHGRPVVGESLPLQFHGGPAEPEQPVLLCILPEVVPNILDGVRLAGILGLPRRLQLTRLVQGPVAITVQVELGPGGQDRRDRRAIEVGVARLHWIQQLREGQHVQRLVPRAQAVKKPAGGVLDPAHRQRPDLEQHLELDDAIENQGDDVAGGQEDPRPAHPAAGPLLHNVVLDERQEERLAVDGLTNRQVPLPLRRLLHLLLVLVILLGGGA
mmetsp:Transcript_10302/g.23253  ORF Transcript_10302/g.23253 Transcript_10302/m.23253 type:complete len:364 (+) Transcript_10302:628-1719(+)